MSERLELDDGNLESAVSDFVTAAEAKKQRNTGVPVEIVRGLTSVGAEVSDFLRGVEAARKALAEGAHQGSLAVSSLMEESRAVDSQISEALGDVVYVKGYM